MKSLLTSIKLKHKRLLLFAKPSLRVYKYTQTRFEEVEVIVRAVELDLRIKMKEMKETFQIS